MGSDSEVNPDLWVFYMDLFTSVTFFQFKFRFAGSYYAYCNKFHGQNIETDMPFITDVFAE